MKKAVLFTFLGLLLALPAWALESRFPVAAYSGPELEKIHQWEAQWAGKKIDKSNIDQVADFLPPTIIKLYKDQETWQAPDDGFYFMVAPSMFSTGNLQKTY